MSANNNMESRLQALIDANKPENRSKWAKKWRKQGKKVIGLVDHYIPEEIISAAGALPIRLTGTWNESAPHAGIYRPAMTCRYCSHVLEGVLTDEIDYIDGFVCVQVDDDFKRLWDILNYIGKPELCHISYLPHSCTPTTMKMWESSVEELKGVVEKWTGNKITDADIEKQIEIYNRMRRLLKQLYQLRKKDVPALTGAEVLGITSAARVMPKEEYIAELEALLPYLETRKAEFKNSGKRILLISEFLDNTDYVKLVENCGCAVVMDEMDTGSLYFWDEVNITGNPLGDVAARYIDRPGTSRMENWTSQIEEIQSWVKEYKADGVVELKQLFSLPLAYRFFILKRELGNAHIPYISLDREYYFGSEGMLSTRVGAFLEMLK